MAPIYVIIAKLLTQVFSTLVNNLTLAHAQHSGITGVRKGLVVTVSGSATVIHPAPTHLLPHKPSR